MAQFFLYHKKNRMKAKNLLSVLGLILFLSSCISSKKYQASLDREQALMARANTLTDSILQIKSELNSLESENAKLIKQIDDAWKEASRLSGMANVTQKQLEGEQKRLWDLRNRMEQQRLAVENLRKKMSDALVNFSSNELLVFVKNGRVYVSLQENLLFPSGSAVVNPKGKQALGSLASVLSANPDITVMVEGHTDTIPIRGKYEDNWALSVARATAIVRILTNTYKVNPASIVASGKGEWEPVAENSTAEGRQKNRRTEIILAPKLDELMRLLENPVTEDSTGTQ
jgi:chemotaxis protein MotB